MIRKSDISELEQLAASQWGMFTTAQAQALGLRRNQISRMVDSVRVEPMCYGVYRFVAGDEPVHAGLKAAWLSIFPKETAAERLSKRPFDAVAAAGTAAAALGAGDFHMSPLHLHHGRQEADVARRHEVSGMLPRRVRRRDGRRAADDGFREDRVRPPAA